MAVEPATVAPKPEILIGRVMHARLAPRRNRFRYGIYYMHMPLAALDAMALPRNRRGLLSFRDRDHGPCDGTGLVPWARQMLATAGIDTVDGDISLVCMPRVLGYVFNPVSFWLCRDRAGGLRAVLCEVHNTFGERHTYICAHDDRRVINGDDVLRGEKVFHVSPFLDRSGHYAFRFDHRADGLSIDIDYFDETGTKTLVTALDLSAEPMTAGALRRAFFSHPLVTAKATTLIHWQALKLVFRRVRFFSRPQQLPARRSGTGNIAKM